MKTSIDSMNAYSRRDFMQDSAKLGLGLAMMGAPMLSLAESSAKMGYSTLNNGIKIPFVGFGTSRMSGSECQRAVEDAISVGYRLIDTAQMYNNEADVGKGVATAIKGGKVKREELFIATKLSSDMSYEQALKAIDESAKKLRLDYIDLILLHKPYPQARNMYKAMEKMQRDGRLKCLGLSNFDVNAYSAFIGDCEIVPVLNQMETHVFFQQRALHRTMLKQNVKLEAWSPFANGKNDFFKDPTLSKVAQKHNKSVAQIALRYLVELDIIVIPKSSKLERMKENINIFDFSLDREDKASLAKLDTNTPYFRWF